MDDHLAGLSNSQIERSWVAVGAFDGVHLGHQAIFERLVSGAHQTGCAAVVITFDPLPGVFFGKMKTGFALTTLAERVRLIQSFGVDNVIILPFNQDLAGIQAGSFMQRLKESFGIQNLLAGFNFTLGKDRTGTVANLTRMGIEIGYTAEIIPPLNLEGEVVSSSSIRKFLHTGDLTKGNRFLGRPYSLTGEVVHGEHRGGKLGIPTANLSIPPDRLIPANGVYATRVWTEGKTYIAVTNIGVRPTFENPLPSPRVEPHLLDEQLALYGQSLSLEFIEYLRPEEKFPDAQALISQINLDIQKTREVMQDEA